MKIAIFGGSFNPIHTGHAMIASCVSQSAGIDEVWLMVSPQNPLKVDVELQPEKTRYVMARLAMEDLPKVRVSDFEFRLPRPSYTYDTLRALQQSYPEDEFVVLIGSDNWDVFDRWREHEKIISEFGVIIYQRPEYPIMGDLPSGVTVVENVPQVLISSTYIREEIKKGGAVNFLVPEKVLKYIKEHKLYQS